MQGAQAFCVGSMFLITFLIHAQFNQSLLVCPTALKWNGSFLAINPFVPSLLNIVRLTKISILFEEGILKKFHMIVAPMSR